MSFYSSLLKSMIPAQTAAVFSMAMVLTACGGGGGSGSSSAQSPGGQSPPTISFSASPASVASGGTTVLSWTTSNADTCTASGGWSGSRPVNGSASSAAITANTTFTLNCNGPGGAAVARATVNIASGTSPSVSLTASPPGVAPGGTTTLSWSSSNVSACTASGGWSGSKSLSGSQATAALNTDQTYTLSCSGSNGNASIMTTVTIRNAVLNWTAPTQNVDGSALTTLAGYKVYWGTASRSYSLNASLSGAGSTTYTTDLAPGTWFFAVSAVDSAGAESAKSSEVSKTVF
jgi:hypothetical protein